MPTFAPPGRFGTVVTAMITPFGEDGSLDVDGAVTLARWLAAHGSDGLVLAGTTGESSVLDDEEKVALWEAVAGAVTVPVVAGTGSNDTAHSVRLTRLAQGIGVSGVLVVAPYYNRPSQHGLRQHFTAVAEATDLPVILYDVPVRTGRRIAPDTLLGLARDVPNIVAVKDAAADVVSASRVVAAAPAGFELYSGDDGYTLPLLAVGAVGAISVASHWVGRAMSDMIARFRAGDVAGAAAANAALLDAVAFQSCDATPNPLPAKAVCRALGLPAGQCRLPMGTAPAELDDRARRLAAALDLGPATSTGAPPAAASRAPGAVDVPSATADGPSGATAVAPPPAVRPEAQRTSGSSVV
ncbi:MAG: 4-hydroxy-tetrahydrodipicolinate synthase [Actinomycetota bacterium]|nr:4-hydroxy-tetrahydrodipicolinate synthase [Actinomycetota bacterium]